MKAIILCEGTTDLLLLQFIMQFKYDWKYDGFVENKISNRLVQRTLKKENKKVEIRSCGGISEIPVNMEKIKDLIQNATKQEEIYDKVMIMIDHDTIESNKEFIELLNQKTAGSFLEKQMNSWSEWMIENSILGNQKIPLYIKCVPEEDTGAIESIMLDALNTDEIEEIVINETKSFVNKVEESQNRYLQKKSKVCKAIFNAYFAIRVPEEKYDERARILKAYDWKNNNILQDSFSFLDI